MRRILAGLLCAGLASAPGGAGFAQNSQPAPPGVQGVPVAPPSAPSPPPEKIAPGGAATHPDQQSLSDRLARQNGTLRPPEGIDPGMPVKPPPKSATTMPVIPPPGTAGGDRHVVPK